MTSCPNIIELDTVDSTMLEAARRLESGRLSPWTTIIARHQTLGRGRSGKTWDSDPGAALLATIAAPVVVPHDRVGLIALAAGSAIADALAEAGVNVFLKWPNDIVVQDRKLGGVLIQNRLGPTITALIGIGINLSALPEGLKREAICLADVLPLLPTPRSLVKRIVAHFQAHLATLETGEWHRIVATWTSRALWIGETVTIDSDGEQSGSFIGVDDFGRLVLRSDGQDKSFAVAEIKRGPRALS